MLYLDMELNFNAYFILLMWPCAEKSARAHDGFAINMHTHITLFCVNELLQILVF